MAWRLAHVTSSGQPLLAYRNKGVLVRLTRKEFTSHLQRMLMCLGLSGYTGHSFRRGGATHALQCGIPPEIIMAQGDWKSMAYLKYIDSNHPKARAQYISSMY